MVGSSVGQERARRRSGGIQEFNYDFRRPRGGTEWARSSGEFVGLGGEVRVAIRMEYQGKQDLEVFSWNKEQGGLLGGSLRTASFWSGGVGSRDKSCHWDGASRSARGFQLE